MVVVVLMREVRASTRRKVGSPDAEDDNEAKEGGVEAPLEGERSSRGEGGEELGGRTIVGREEEGSSSSSSGRCGVRGEEKVDERREEAAEEGPVRLV